MNNNAEKALAEHVKIISLRDNFHFVNAWYELANERHFWIQWRMQVLKKILLRHGISLTDKLHGVDIGCGNSVLRCQIEKITNWIMDGAELDKFALGMPAQTRGQLFLYDIRDRNDAFFEKYDLITMFDILEHYHDPTAFLEDAKFHLKKGGYCIINVPAIELLRSRYDEVAGHELRYSQKILKKHIKSAGFELIDIRYWGFSLILPLWIRRFIVSFYEDGEEVIKKGFSPPGQAAHLALKLMKNIESSLLPRPPLGTSIMAIAQKL